MSKWRKFNALPVRDRSRLIIYVLLLPLIHLCLGWFGYARLHRFLASHPLKQPAFQGENSQGMEEANHTAYLVSIAGRNGFFPATCLRQSLLVFWLLRCRGIQTELRIGVQHREGKVIAHAWVTRGDELISDSSQVGKDFSPFIGFHVD
jgi:hypothetical protein